MNANVLSQKRSKAFSLVELLVVIAVIAIVASMAIPAINFVTDQAGTTKNQRNAQNIVSMANAALAAGYSAPWNTSAEVIADLADGIYVPITGGQPMELSLSSMNEADIEGASRHIVVVRNDGIMPIVDSGNSSATVTVYYSPEPIESPQLSGEVVFLSAPGEILFVADARPASFWLTRHSRFAA